MEKEGSRRKGRGERLRERTGRDWKEAKESEREWSAREGFSSSIYLDFLKLHFIS